MLHRVQYHNPSKYGPYRPRRGEFQIMTAKSVDNMRGDTVWLVSRRAAPTDYILCSTFVVDEVGLLPHGPLPYFAKGSKGVLLAPPVSIGDKDWFKQLLQVTGNFRWGLQPIKSREIVDGLLIAVRDAA
jgi:hypothetical protein